MATSKKPSRVTLIRAADVKPEALEFLWRDRIPKATLTLIGGRPGMGKSLFTNYLAAEVTKAGGAVVMSNPEDALAWVKVPRLIAAKADTRLIHFWPGKIHLPEDVELLEELVLFHDVRLVTIDPIGKHIRGRDPSSALEPLVAMCERTGCTAVGVHHLNKGMGKNAVALDAFGGAYGGWVGTARFAHVLGPAPGGDEGARYMGVAKSNLAPDDIPSVEFYIDEVEVDLPDGSVMETGRFVFVNDTSSVSGDAIVQSGGSGGFKHQGGEKLKAAVEWLTLLLMNGPKKATEIMDGAAEVGLSPMTARRAATELKVVKRRHGFGPGSYLEWHLPATHPLAKSIGASTAPAGDIDEELKALLEEAYGDGTDV